MSFFYELLAIPEIEKCGSGGITEEWEDVYLIVSLDRHLGYWGRNTGSSKGNLERVLQKEHWVLERETGAIGVVEFKEQLFESRNSEKLTLFFRFE